MWDRLVISCPTFPAYYWDKFVKKKVLEKYGGQFEQENVSLINNPVQLFLQKIYSKFELNFK